MPAERRFRAMGSDAHVLVVGGGADMSLQAEGRVAVLESLWSRFLERSEVSFLNTHQGRPVIVSEDTFRLVSIAVDAWRTTNGRFDPTVGAALSSYGYGVDLKQIPRIVTVESVPGRTRGCGEIILDGVLHAVTLPRGVVFDPGGIGKGLAADLVVEELIADGAEGALVNLGGDLRVEGRAPGDEGWIVRIEDPFDPTHQLATISIPRGAVATSSRLKRRWQTDGGPAHHLFDPHRGTPAETDVVAVTVVAGEAWRAEVLAKQLFLGGPESLTELGDASAVMVTVDRRIHSTFELGRMAS